MRKEFDVLYFSNRKGEGRKYSHKYREAWERIDMFCPNCGKHEVWHEDSAGDYYVGESYICLVCKHHWTIQGPHEIRGNDEQYSQRLENLQACEATT